MVEPLLGLVLVDLCWSLWYKGLVYFLKEVKNLWGVGYNPILGFKSCGFDSQFCVLWRSLIQRILLWKLARVSVLDRRFDKRHVLIWCGLCDNGIYSWRETWLRGVDSAGWSWRKISKEWLLWLLYWFLHYKGKISLGGFFPVEGFPSLHLVSLVLYLSWHRSCDYMLCLYMIIQWTNE
jgi:hypothetical protein